MTKLEFMVRAFTLQNEALKSLADNQKELFTAIIEARNNPDNTYSDIVSDGGLDPRTKYEAERFKRQWVGLTDEEMEQVYSSIYGAGTEHENLVEMGRATEAKLKEKNG
jgi:hypothetical protein